MNNNDLIHKKNPEELEGVDLDGISVYDRETGRKVIYDYDKKYNEFTGEEIVDDNDPDLFPSEYND